MNDHDNFRQKLKASSVANRSLLCIGLDPDPEIIPANRIVDFLRGIVSATNDCVCAYKPNLAFFEAYGIEGWEALFELKQLIPSEIPVICDAKRGDVPNTAALYAKAIFEVWDFDAATVNPYAGADSIAPFLAYTEKGILIFCHSSNPGAGDFQEMEISLDGVTRPLYEWIAVRSLDWDSFGNVGLVVGATYPIELSKIREICPVMPILIPGIGPQQGDLETAVKAGVDYDGRGIMVNSSRQVIYASTGSDFPDAARKTALKLRERINLTLEEIGKRW